MKLKAETFSEELTQRNGQIFRILPQHNHVIKIWLFLVDILVNRLQI